MVVIKVTLLIDEKQLFSERPYCFGNEQWRLKHSVENLVTVSLIQV